MSRTGLTRKDALLLGLVCLLAAAFALWAVPGARDYRAQSLRQQQMAREARQDLELARDRFRELDKAYQDLKEDVDHLTRFLSTGLSRSELFQEIDDLVRQAGLSLISLQPGKTLQADEYRTQTVSVQCQGPVLQILDFIQDLEGLNTPLVLKEVRLIPSGSSQLYRVLIQGKLIRLPADQA